MLVEMIHHWERTKAIFAVRQDREESVFQKLFSNNYYSLIRKTAIQNYPKEALIFSWLTARLWMSESHSKRRTRIMTLIYWLGFNHSHPLHP